MKKKTMEGLWDQLVAYKLLKVMSKEKQKENIGM